MTEVLHFSSSSSPTASSSDGILHVSAEQEPAPPSSAAVEGFATVTDCEARGVTDRTQQELSLLAILVTLLRKSLIACKSEGRGDLCAMEIGWPTNVRHVAHVTFDRFNGFLGLPREFEPEVSTRSPSARYHAVPFLIYLMS